jgi:hypothetical protein
MFVVIKTAGLSMYVPWSQINISIPPIPVLIAYILALIMIAGCAPLQLKNLAKWLLPALLLLIPAVLLVQSIIPRTEIACFSLREGSCAAVRFPNGKNWIIGEPVETPYIKSSRDAICPWMRGQWPDCIDAVVLPVAGCNAVHDLEPILKRYRTNMIIGIDQRTDTPAKNDFCGFLAETSTPLVKWTPETKFVPSPGCTAVIEESFDNKGGQSGIIKISVPGAQLIFTSRDVMNAGETDKNTKTTKVYFDGEMAQISDNSVRRYDVRNSGAVVVEVRQDKIDISVMR